MRAVGLVVVLLVGAACGAPQAPAADPPPPPDAAPAPRTDVACGPHTCGPDEYCEIRCTCCGAYIPDPAQASAEYLCQPLPDVCRTADPPECRQRTVHTPCA